MKCARWTHCSVWCLFLQQEDVSVQLEALDILGDLLSRFGGNHCYSWCIDMIETSSILLLLMMYRHDRDILNLLISWGTSLADLEVNDICYSCCLETSKVSPSLVLLWFNLCNVCLNSKINKIQWNIDMLRALN
jgi:hypothetical protein